MTFDHDAFLDDILDDFHDEKTAFIEKPRNPASSTRAEDIDEDAFMASLAAGMEDMLKQGVFDPADMEQLTKGMESFTKEVKTKKSTIAAPSENESFQAKITETMNNMNTSSIKVDEELASGSGGINENPGDMEQMMKEFEGMMASGELDNMFDGVFDQFVSRDLLYEPMKDLSIRYPAWIKENSSSLSKEDFDRYQSQQRIISDIVAIFDKKQGKEDPSEGESKEIATLLQKMQDFGNPPEALMPELNGALGTDSAIPNPESCAQM